MLILDEATSALDVATGQRLFAILRELAAGGTAVVFISHRMDEIGEIADRVTVMRSGETVATLPHGEASADSLVTLMTGERHGVLDQVASRETKLRSSCRPPFCQPPRTAGTHPDFPVRWLSYRTAYTSVRAANSAPKNATFASCGER